MEIKLTTTTGGAASSSRASSCLSRTVVRRRAAPWLACSIGLLNNAHEIAMSCVLDKWTPGVLHIGYASSNSASGDRSDS